VEKFIESITITHILPCVVPGKIRFHADLSVDISPLMPYLNRLMKGAIYTQKTLTLTFKKEGGLITLYPRKVAGGQIENIELAHRILNWLKGLVNECYENKDKIEPLYERQVQLLPLDVYKFLPQTNCKKCAEETCLAFAVKLIVESKSVMLCPDLFTPTYAEKRSMLFTLLKDTGYSTPSGF
jgi:ArsR family metal-binding transcriptional regulator